MTHSTDTPAASGETGAAKMREAAQTALIERLWQSLLDKDDRNSPEEYPDMAMLTFEEFAGYIRAATDPHSERIAALTEALEGAEAALEPLDAYFQANFYPEDSGALGTQEGAFGVDQLRACADARAAIRKALA